MTPNVNQSPAPPATIPARKHAITQSPNSSLVPDSPYHSFIR